MITQSIGEYSKKEIMVVSLIESDADFQAFYVLPFVAGLGRQNAMLLFSCMTKEVFEQGKVVYRASEASAGRMYLVLDGKVNVRNESGYTFSSLRKGDVFGLFSFLDEQRKYSATLTIEQKATVLTLDRAYFDLIAIEEPRLGCELMRFMFGLLSKKASELEVEYTYMYNFAFGGKV